jgi:hypothetical protein
MKILAPGAYPREREITFGLVSYKIWPDLVCALSSLLGAATVSSQSALGAGSLWVQYPETSILLDSGADPALLPTPYLTYHGQAKHNVNLSNVFRRDTILIATGQLQVVDLGAALPASSRPQIGAVVASPLRRALQTALIGFEDLIIPDSAKVVANWVSVNTTVLDATQTHSKPLRLVALPEAQETSD